jgi:hypothetical protein
MTIDKDFIGALMRVLRPCSLQLIDEVIKFSNLFGKC